MYQAGVLQQHRPRLCQLLSAVRVKQHHLQIFFQLTHHARHRWLGHLQILGCLGEASQPSNRLENPDMAQIPQTVH